MIFDKFFNKSVYKDVEEIKKEINNINEELGKVMENMKIYIRCKLQEYVPNYVNDTCFDKEEIRDMERELNRKISSFHSKPPRVSKKSNHLDEVVRLKRLGKTQFQIADSLGLSQGSVSKYIRKAKDIGMLEDKRLHGKTNLVHLEINKEEEVKLQ